MILFKLQKRVQREACVLFGEQKCKEKEIVEELQRIVKEEKDVGLRRRAAVALLQISKDEMLNMELKKLLEEILLQDVTTDTKSEKLIALNGMLLLDPFQGKIGF
jgi:hypothetical protein